MRRRGVLILLALAGCSSARCQRAAAPPRAQDAAAAVSLPDAGPAAASAPASAPVRVARSLADARYAFAAAGFDVSQLASVPWGARLSAVACAEGPVGAATVTLCQHQDAATARHAKGAVARAVARGGVIDRVGQFTLGCSPIGACTDILRAFVALRVEP